jgi:hypothetical protein
VAVLAGNLDRLTNLEDIDTSMNPLSLCTALVALIGEALNGPPAGSAHFLNAGDEGLAGSLARLSAGEASARPDGRSSVAAHVRHILYGLELLNREARGEAISGTNYAASWTQQEVTDAEWTDLRGTLDRHAHDWMSAVGQRTDWDAEALTTVVAELAHVAYHLGAIRQLAAAAAGPPARD